MHAHARVKRANPQLIRVHWLSKRSQHTIFASCQGENEKLGIFIKLLIILERSPSCDLYPTFEKDNGFTIFPMCPLPYLSFSVCQFSNVSFSLSVLFYRSFSLPVIFPPLFVLISLLSISQK